MPALHGFPLRLVITGYPGSASQKHLTRIWVRDQVHDGPKMTGYSYRIPGYPVAPGTEVPESDVEILTVMPVKSIVTFPQTGSQEGGDVALSSEYGNLPDTPGIEETSISAHLALALDHKAAAPAAEPLGLPLDLDGRNAGHARTGTRDQANNPVLSEAALRLERLEQPPRTCRRRPPRRQTGRKTDGSPGPLSRRKPAMAS